ncbi:perforin 1 [Chelydra serpentina]|uniref:Perforin 1 n=1 Tax=Chelydra serpentina TaxID=8475 RepID=A0A8T1SCL3_CHESE|nr:perforin 1 [Chelydra serpentina]
MVRFGAFIPLLLLFLLLGVSPTNSLNLGMARLKVHIMRGTDLYGDTMTDTDAYVRVVFLRQKRQTSEITDDNNPSWNEDLVFGPVMLPAEPVMEIEVWDSDPWYDDLLGGCRTYLEVGSSGTLTCNLEYGYIKFSYTLECGPNMGGNKCHEYVPVSG